MTQANNDPGPTPETPVSAARVPWSAPTITAVAIDVVTETATGPSTDASTLGSS